MVVDIYASNLFLYLAHFNQPDTLTAGGPQGLNRYAYGLNNPSRYTDPSGHKACDEINADGKCISKDSASSNPQISTTTTLDPKLNSAQKKEINDAMDTIFKMFGGAEKFYAETGILNLSFVFVTKLTYTQDNAVSCYVGNGVIEMTSTVLTRRD